MFREIFMIKRQKRHSKINNEIKLKYIYSLLINFFTFISEKHNTI